MCVVVGGGGGREGSIFGPNAKGMSILGQPLDKNEGNRLNDILYPPP